MGGQRVVPSDAEANIQDTGRGVAGSARQKTPMAHGYSGDDGQSRGSFARDVPDQTSDVDILVELTEPTFDHYMDLKFLLEEQFQRPIDLVLADTVKPRLKPIISREVEYA